MNDNLKLPLHPAEIILKKDFDRTDIAGSIKNMIHLILITSPGDLKFDPGFGTEIWKYDFDNIYNTHFLKEELKKSVTGTIMFYEKRLTNVKVDLHIEQVEINTRIRNRRVKTQIRMNISGVVEKTNESFFHKESFFIGPLSY